MDAEEARVRRQEAALFTVRLVQLDLETKTTREVLRVKVSTAWAIVDLKRALVRAGYVDAWWMVCEHTRWLDLGLLTIACAGATHPRWQCVGESSAVALLQH